ncbi:Taurine dioxygenase [Catenulispora acidiphila DSM 44928]|uniref:Taurine dioxygenase n=1 Tax=Catenulispora acidiphila (strain DSM 44928 / JCM 14897 / NBRC 102108 / NRRL B-24433 / ID139908) TaxID=479433 RepID=C7QCF2_CATAD|nr:TauD/TfdA family dioxygenase [Catenulispora acidiphila]ACU74600.1 Taurine dioxygenase [Catenulispora acidiphila DSM 44928]
MAPYATLQALLTGRDLAAGPRRGLRRLPEGEESRPYETVTVTPCTRLIGAQISGIDLGEPVAPEVFAELDRALLEFKVLFFRGQSRVTAARHRDFAGMWGELEIHPFLPQGDVAEIVRFEKSEREAGVENVWHADVTWREKPALGSVLRAVEVPEAGGDTCFADMAAAYDCLPEQVKARIEGRVAVHDFTLPFGIGMDPDKLKEMQEKYPAVEHPVVRTHPRTGRRTLFVNAIFTTHIVGLPEQESEELLKVLFRQASVPEYQVRFKWEPGSIAFWDNRAVQHYAVSDYFPRRRVMERAAILGDRPR